MNSRTAQHGFTLVELMVTLVVAFLVIAAVYASYVVQQRTQKEQQQVTQIQQNLRAGLMMMAREFKMAGYDPTLNGGYGITKADPDIFSFTADLCEDGGAPKPAATPATPCPGAIPDADQPYAMQRLEETYTYQLFDSNGDGIKDALQRVQTGGLAVSIAENIEQIEFSYLLDTGAVLEKVNSGQVDHIQAVQVTMLARAGEPDYRFTHQQTYTTKFGKEWNPANADSFPIANSLNYRRRILLATFELRNMGLL